MQLTFSLITLFLWIYLFFFYSTKGKKKITFWSNKVIFENEKIKSKKLKFKICIIIPARNEEKTIVNTLNSIISQKIKDSLILIVDDNSTDKTQKKIRDFLKNINYKNCKLINGKPLPIGWSGKVWALKQAVDFLKQKNFSHFLFVDSDIVLKKKIITNSINFLEDRNLLMVSLMAKLKCESLWERVLIPSFIYFFQKIYPFNKVNNPKSQVAAAAGGFMLCKSKVFENHNLYDSIKNKIIDDCNIANLIKKKGPIWLGLTNQITSSRGYTKLSQIWRMVSRTAYEQLKNSLVFLKLSLLGMFLLYQLPLISGLFAIFNSKYEIFLINLITTLFIILSFIPTVNFYKLKYSYSLLLPLSSFIYILMTISSAYNYYFRQGNSWKGRKY